MATGIVQVSAPELEVNNIGGQLVVDSRLVAARLDIEHRALFRTINKYLTELQGFGQVRFENTAETSSLSGQKNLAKFAYLNENQSALLMTMSRNTKQVIQCKIDLVKAFSAAKQIIKTVIPAQNEHIRLLELENENLNLRSHMVDKTNNMVIMHGEALGLTIAGLNVGQIIETKIPTTEVLNPVTGSTSEFLSADQLAKEVKRRTGQNIKNAEFIRKLKSANRDDLILPVSRTATSEYVKPEDLGEAIEIVFGSGKQGLLKPVGL